MLIPAPAGFFVSTKLVDKRLLFFTLFAIVKLMVKLREGKKKQAGVKDSAVVSSEFKKVYRLPSLPKISWAYLKTKQGITILAIVILFITMLVVVTVWTIREYRKPVVTKLPTQQEYVNSKIDSLEEGTPPTTASKQEQLQYYDQLQNFYELAENYKKAAEIFEKRASLESSDLDYLDYSKAARYYRNIGDKSKAIAAINKAISLLPPQANEETGYDPVLEKQSLEQFKEELQK